MSLLVVDGHHLGVELVTLQIIPARTFQRFDGAVFGPCCHLESFAYSLDRLVVMTVGNQAGSANNFGKTGIFFDIHRMGGRSRILVLRMLDIAVLIVASILV